MRGVIVELVMLALTRNRKRKDFTLWQTQPVLSFKFKTIKG